MNEILRRSTPQNAIGQEPAVLIPEVQLQAKKVTQIHLVAQAIWRRVKKQDIQLALTMRTERLERSEDAIYSKLLEPQRGAARH